MCEALSCPGNETPAPGYRLGALYWACVRNDSAQLQAILDHGVSPEEATQVDGSGRVSYPGCFLGPLRQVCVPTTRTHPERVSGPTPIGWVLRRKGVGESGSSQGLRHLWDRYMFRGAPGGKRMR